MHRRQKWVVFLGTCLLITQMMFPPFKAERQGEETLVGYYFLPSVSTFQSRRDKTKQDREPRYLTGANIDAGLLLVQIFGSILIFSGVFILLHPSPKLPKKRQDEVLDRHDGQGAQPAEEFYDVGDNGDR